MVDNFAAVLAFDYKINNIIQLNLVLMFLLILIQLEPTLVLRLIEEYDYNAAHREGHRSLTPTLWCPWWRDI